MSEIREDDLLAALLNSWDRNNTILVNLLHAIPEDGMTIRGSQKSPTIAELFSHINYVRLVFIEEDAPEFARPAPLQEWTTEEDRNRMASLLNQSAQVVRDGVQGRLKSGRLMDQHYDHPILLLQHMIWHEGYHHGQIKLALKTAGIAMEDVQIGPLTWDIWMNKSGTNEN